MIDFLSTKLGFSVKHCIISKNSYICPDALNKTYSHNQTFVYSKILRQDLIKTTIQYNFNIPISNFVHVDHIFRSYLDVNNNYDICTLKQSNFNKQVYFFKEFFFKFFRLC
jgi:hypothetical protein